MEGHRYENTEIHGGNVHMGDVIKILPSDTTAQDRINCLAALCTNDPRDERQRLISTKGHRIKGTCEWIKSTDQYRTWNATPSSQVLRITGGPGKGKTMISIFLTEELERVAKTAPATIVLQYFCNGKDEVWNTAIGIVRGLIYQLLWEKESPSRHILHPYQVEVQRQKDAKDKGEPIKDNLLNNFWAMWNIFENMLEDYSPGQVYCVIDGLDECDNTSIETLLVALSKLYHNMESTACFKLILVSRPLSGSIPNPLSSFPAIKLGLASDYEVHEDLKLFTASRISEIFPGVPETDTWRVDLETKLLKKAEGTFLWASFAVEALKTKTRHEANGVLEGLPPGLDAMYGRELLRIPPERRETAIWMLQWIVIAVRPLTLIELYEAVLSRQLEQSASIAPEEVIIEYIDRCGYILAVNGKTVGLVHQSAKDYLLRPEADLEPVLESFRIVEKMAHASIAQRCIEYLQGGCLDHGRVIIGESKHQYYKQLAIDTVILDKYPLLSYSVLQWPIHARCSEADIFDLTTSFFAEDSKVRDYWWETYAYIEGSSQVRCSLLHIAAHFDMCVLVKSLLPDGNNSAPKGKSPTIKSKWRSQIMQLLRGPIVDSKDVRRRPNMDDRVNCKDEEGHTPMTWAIERGHVAVVQLLLDSGATVDAKGRRWGQTPLSIAAGMGYQAVVRLLLDRGTAVDLRDQWDQTPLFKAAENGHKAVVQLLLDNGATIDAKYFRGQTPLWIAAESGHEAVVWLLLVNGAAVDAKDGSNHTPLWIAASMGREAVVRLLLDNGATVDTKDGGGQTPLWIAAKNGHEAVVRILLDNGTTVDTKADRGRTPLWIAAHNGHEAVVRLLLDNGTTVDTKDYMGQTPLWIAASMGREAIMRLLLENGATVDTKNDEGQTPLLVAAEMGHKALARLLLDNGGSIDTKDNGGQIMLSMAAEREA